MWMVIVMLLHIYAPYFGSYRGGGFIAGIAPGIVMFDGVPAAREVEVRARKTRSLVYTLMSRADGAYKFDGLDPNTEFDIIGRDWSNTYNDVIWSRVKPYPYDVKTLTGAFTVGALNSLAGALELYGGEDHVVSTAGSPPPGITFDVEWGEAPDFDHAGAWVTASGTTTPGSYSWDLTVTAKNGTAKTVSLSLVVT